MPRAKLTESYIKSVPQPARSLYELHWDTEAKGLTLRVTTTASRHFVFCYTADGSNKRHTIGRWIAPPSNRLGMPATREFVGSLEWARREARQLIGAVAGGEDPASAKERGARCPGGSQAAGGQGDHCGHIGRAIPRGACQTQQAQLVQWATSGDIRIERPR